MTYKEKIADYFISWLKSKSIYSEFVKEFKKQFNITSDISEKEFIKLLFKETSSIYNFMVCIDLDKTEKGGKHWWRLSDEWSDYFKTIEEKLNHLKITFKHILNNDILIVESRNFSYSTHGINASISFLTETTSHELQKNVVSFFKRNKVEHSTIHPNGVFFIKENIQVTIEENTF